LYAGDTIFSLVGWIIFWRQNSKRKRSKNDGPELFETYFSWIDSISELLCSKNDDIYDVNDTKKKKYENGYYEYIIKT
jgi:hypothetical protein